MGCVTNKNATQPNKSADDPKVYNIVVRQLESQSQDNKSESFDLLQSRNSYEKYLQIKQKFYANLWQPINFNSINTIEKLRKLLKYANEERDKLNLIEPLTIYEGIVDAFHRNFYDDIESQAQAKLGLGTAVLFANDLSELHLIGGCLIKSAEELLLQIDKKHPELAFVYMQFGIFYTKVLNDNIKAIEYYATAAETWVKQIEFDNEVNPQVMNSWKKTKVVNMYVMITMIYVINGEDNQKLAAFCGVGLDYAKGYQLDTLNKPSKENIHAITTLKNHLGICLARAGKLKEAIELQEANLSFQFKKSKEEQTQEDIDKTKQSIDKFKQLLEKQEEILDNQLEELKRSRENFE